ncbi:MAG: hypothetical protein KIT44_13230 [Opitutaceae bacterium]|nr:hypothetical protein [Opitutaceae bacterium]
MKRALLLLGSVFMFSACAWESGRVIEFKLSPPADRSAMGDALHIVAREMGLVVEGPETGPGGIVEYRAKYPSKSSTVDFFISVEMGDRPSIVIRTMNTQAIDPALAERAFDLFRAELDKRGIKYELRRS